MSVKLDSYVKDYTRVFDENKRLKELVSQLREDKEQAIMEITKNKSYQHNRVIEVQDQANEKIANLESIMVDMKERHKGFEERAYSVMVNQEKITEKWKEEHRKSVQYFEKAVKYLEVENRHLQEQCIELKGRMRHVGSKK